MRIILLLLTACSAGLDSFIPQAWTTATKFLNLLIFGQSENTINDFMSQQSLFRRDNQDEIFNRNGMIIII